MAGQRASGLIDLLSSLGIRQSVVLVPKLEISKDAKEFPLQNFYIPVLKTGLNEENSSGVMSGSIDATLDMAVFTSLPKQHTLTVRTDAPENWNIQAVDAIQDIDNLRCVSASAGMCDPRVLKSIITILSNT